MHVLKVQENLRLINIILQYTRTYGQRAIVVHLYLTKQYQTEYDDTIVIIHYIVIMIRGK